MQEINVRHNHSRDLLFCVIIFVVPTTCSTLTLTFLLTLLRHYEISYDSIPLDNILYWITNTFTFNITFTYFVTLFAINSRLYLIMSVLRDERLMENISILHARTKLILKLYTNCYDLVCVANKCFTFHSMLLLLEFTTFCVSITFMIFTTFSSHLDLGVSFKDIIFLTTAVAFFVNLNIHACIVFYNSCTIKENGRKILSSICVVAEKTKNEKLLKYSQLSSLHMVRDQLIVTCGMFEFDWRQKFLMLSSIFSYLLILIQFDMSDSFN